MRHEILVDNLTLPWAGRESRWRPQRETGRFASISAFALTYSVKKFHYSAEFVSACQIPARPNPERFRREAILGVDMFKSDPLLDIGLNMLRDEAPNLEPSKESTVSSLLTRFIDGSMPYVQVRQLVIEVIGTAAFIDKVQEILTCPDTPIPEPRTHLGFDGIGSRKKTQSWTAQEDVRLFAGVHRFGLSTSCTWSAVAEFVGNGRTRSQCSQRWIRALDPRISKGHWTKEDEDRLANLVARMGEKSWMKVACEMGNRSDVQCRYHYIQMQKGATRVSPSKPAHAGQFREVRMFDQQPGPPPSLPLARPLPPPPALPTPPVPFTPLTRFVMVPQKVQVQFPPPMKIALQEAADKENGQGVPLNRTPFELKKSDPFFDSNPWLFGME
jgi:hypothetical protein